MIGSVYLEGGVFNKGGEYSSSPAEAESSRLSKGGSYSLRRENYFNDIWHEKMISYNLRVALVDNIAMLYANRGVALPELIKEGNLGLTHALENFELEGGSRFSTYAARCIRHNIEHAVTSHSGKTQSPALLESHHRR